MPIQIWKREGILCLFLSSKTKAFPALNFYGSKGERYEILEIVCNPSIVKSKLSWLCLQNFFTCKMYLYLHFFKNIYVAQTLKYPGKSSQSKQCLWNKNRAINFILLSNTQLFSSTIFHHPNTVSHKCESFLNAGRALPTLIISGCTKNLLMFAKGWDVVKPQKDYHYVLLLQTRFNNMKGKKLFHFAGYIANFFL